MPNPSHSGRPFPRLRRPLFFGAVIALAIIVAVLSLPSSLEGVGLLLERSLGPWAPLIALLLGLLHGLKPDEHTWPITVPYALGQGSVRKGVLASLIFTGALTSIWTLLAGAASLLKQELVGSRFTPLVDILAGLIMLGVASYLLLSGNGEQHRPKRPSYKLIWVHGLTAAFGGDFIAVLAYTVAFSGILLPASLGWLVGLLFGLGTMGTQGLIAYAAVRSAGLVERRLKASVFAESSTYSLGFLGLFLIVLGLLS